MQEKASDASGESFLTGGELNGWPVPTPRSATAAKNGFATWSDADSIDYLGTGRNAHAAVGGEMKSAVEHSLSYLTDADLQPITIYLREIRVAHVPTPSRGTEPGDTTAKLTSARDLTSGERRYLDRQQIGISVSDAP